MKNTSKGIGNLMGIPGLKHFKEFFSEDKDKFILIGGTATILSLEAVGDSRGRGTKDLDLVFIVELLNNDFIDKFLKYVALGGYDNRISNGKSQFYRFENPKNPEFPKMIEILSRKPDLFANIKLKNATKLTVSEEISSLSALILDDKYYHFIVDNCEENQGIMIATIECLVLLKIRAYNDLKSKKALGDQRIKSEDIKKHKNDVFRLAQNFTEDKTVTCTEYMKDDIKQFNKNMSNDEVDVQNLNLRGTKKEIINLIFKVFNVEEQT